MNINEAAEVANEVMKHEKSDEKSYMSVHVHRNSDQSDSNQLLKRSPVVRDVTSGFAQISSTSQLMQKRKMTILVPASLDKTISLEALNPTGNINSDRKLIGQDKWPFRTIFGHFCGNCIFIFLKMLNV